MRSISAPSWPNRMRKRFSSAIPAATFGRSGSPPLVGEGEVVEHAHERDARACRRSATRGCSQARNSSSSRRAIAAGSKSPGGRSSSSSTMPVSSAAQKSSRRLSTRSMNGVSPGIARSSSACASTAPRSSRAVSRSARPSSGGRRARDRGGQLQRGGHGGPAVVDVVEEVVASCAAGARWRRARGRRARSAGTCSSGCGRQSAATRSAARRRRDPRARAARSG